MEMTSDNETVAEIVSEMRRDAIAADAWCETHGEMASAASVLNRHADRIDSAHKREVARLVANIDALEQAIEIVCDKKTVKKIIAKKMEIKNGNK